MNIDRRELFQHLLKIGAGYFTVSLLGCGRDSGFTYENSVIHTRQKVTLYDTYAQALYMDGTFGPTTGIIKVSYIQWNEPVTLDFWHGHGGKLHEFTVTEDHYRDLRKLKRVYIETTSVQSHTHKLFIDPADPKWRVPGSTPVIVDDGRGNHQG